MSEIEIGVRVFRKVVRWWYEVRGYGAWKVFVADRGGGRREATMVGGVGSVFEEQKPNVDAYLALKVLLVRVRCAAKI